MKSYKHGVEIKNFEFEIKPLKSELKILIRVNEGIEFSIFKYLQKNEILSLGFINFYLHQKLISTLA